MVDISIVVPIYNASKYLNKCLDSLVNQTKKELEFILVNDGSTDDSDSIIKNYSDNRIKHFRRSNHGIGKTRNFGISKATGKYIMFLDSDDYLDLEACELLYKKIEKDKSDLVVFDFYRVSDSLEPVIIRNFKGTNLRENPNLLLEINLGIANKIFRLNIIKENNIKFIEDLKYEDAPFVVEYFKYARKISKLDAKLHYYVIHDNSETTIRDEKMFDIIKIVDIIRSYYKDIDWSNDVINALTIKILVNYNIQQRYIKNKNIRNRFIDESFSYLEKNIPDYKNKRYYLNKGIIRRMIEKNKFLTKFYCKIYQLLKT